MIQRKQTLFLLAVAIIAVILLFVPFFSYTSNISDGTFTLLNATGKLSNAYFLMIINNMVILIALITIFLFKKRTVQFKLSNLLILLNIFITGLAFLLPFEHDQIKAYATLWAFLPVVTALFSYLAAHFIKKDDQLVRNADRIR